MASQVQAAPSGLRIERWTAAAALLLFPLVMMQVGREWTLSVGLIAMAVIAAILALVDLATRKVSDPGYRAGVTVAVAASLWLVWITVVGGITGSHANPNNVAFLIFFLTPAVGAFAAGGRAAGMARAMVGVAIAQALLVSLTVTDPTTAGDPRGVNGTLLLGGYFTALWLVSAFAFWQSSRRQLG